MTLTLYASCESNPLITRERASVKPQNVFEHVSGKRLARGLGHCPARFQFLSIGTARAIASVPCALPVSTSLAWTDTPDRPS